MSAVLGWGHDFGKLTEWFQANFDERPATVGRDERYTYHSLLGAILVQYALAKRGYNTTTQGLGFHATAAHHRAMSDLTADTERYAATYNAVENRLDRVAEQLANIRQRVPDLAGAILDTMTVGRGSLEEFAAYLDDREFAYRLNELKKWPPTTAYGDLLYLTGILKLADRSVVVERDFRSQSLQQPVEPVPPTLQRSLPSPDAVESAIEALPGDGGHDRLDGIRTNVQKRARIRATTHLKRDGPGFVGTIQLPTGFGKTHAGLWTGLSLASAVARRDPHDDRSLVYVLPYTTIIDQTAETIDKIYGQAEPPADYLLDHYLAETAVDFEDGVMREEIDDDAAATARFFLGNAWRSNTILSTFVQLFESLAGPTSKQSTKLPSLQESVIVLDEPQLLDTEWWPVVGRLAEVLVEQFDATLLVMTATQPRIVENYSSLETVELVTHEDGPLELLRDNPRVSYELDGSLPVDDIETGGDGLTEPLAYDEAGTRIRNCLDSGDSALGVCNTISSAQSLDKAIREALTRDDRSAVSLGAELHRWLDTQGRYPQRIHGDELCEFEQRIQRRLDDTEGVLLVHLSSRLRPPDRLRLVEFLKRSVVAETAQTIVTSTQLVEAGVDLSVDYVFRDLAPVPSLVQSGGRCNRSLRSDMRGTVTVWRLGPPPLTDHERLPSRQIYGTNPDRLTPTIRALRAASDGNTVPEYRMITSVVDDFYERLHERDPGDQGIADAVNAVETRRLARASLIDDRPDQVDVVVARVDSERTTLQRLRRAVEAGAWEAVQDLLGSLRELRYSVPESELSTLRAADETTRVEIYDSPTYLVDAVDLPKGFDPQYGV